MSNYTENFPNLSTYDFDTIMCQLRQVCGADPSGMINAQFLSRPTTAKDIAQLFYCTKYIMDGSVNLQNQYVELYTFVKDFFTNLDLQEEVNNVLKRMYDDGSLSNLLKPIILSTLPPYVVDSTDEMEDINRTYILKENSHIYQYINNNWIDTGIIYGSDIGNVITYIGSMEENADYNLLKENTWYVDSDASNKLNPPKNNGAFYVLTVGSPTHIQLAYRFTSVYNPDFYYRRMDNEGNWSDWVSNETYIKYNGSMESGNDYNEIPTNTWYVDSDASNKLNAPSTNGSFYVLTVGSTNLSEIQLAVEFSAKYNPGFYYRRKTIENTWSSWVSNKSYIKYNGSMSTGQDYNDIPINTWCVDTNASNKVNAPSNSGAYYILTIGTENATAMQFAIKFTKTGLSTLYRIKGADQVWSEWTGSSDEIYGNGKMISFGNSILNGSVWKSGEYDHLSAYGNAPYSVIANGLNIAPSNVNNTLLSSTGLLYDAGQGSFLENIKKTDLKKFDVLLTHLWTGDMSSSFPLGSIDSVADDGTIAGGVMSLLNYMKNNNGMCQLILVGVPPVSTTIKGEEVFTGLYGNGKSIKDCDSLMHELADKYHFIYVDWESLNISYYYQNYTDGKNVHANNENTYKVMGAYLSGRISSQLTF